MQIKYPKLELLNFEGPVLVATKHHNLYIITDEWKETGTTFGGGGDRLVEEKERRVKWGDCIEVGTWVAGL